MRAGLQSRRARVVLAVLVVQVGIPVAAFVHGVPSRFGFHMYSGQTGLTVEAVDAQGASVPVDFASWMAGARVELDWTEVLPTRICDEVDEVAVVTVTSGKRSRSLTCPA